jgi:hypothetical protein
MPGRCAFPIVTLAIICTGTPDVRRQHRKPHFGQTLTMASHPFNDVHADVQQDERHNTLDASSHEQNQPSLVEEDE